MAGTLLFPDPPRDFRGRRALKILLRALHVLCVGVFVGGAVFGVPAGVARPWLWGTVGTGAAILVLDLHESAAFLLQVRGAVVVAKIALLATSHWWGALQIPLLAALVVVSSVSSHAPGSVRYHLLLRRGRVAAGRTKG
jgi:hypothetical protein